MGQVFCCRSPGKERKGRLSNFIPLRMYLDKVEHISVLSLYLRNALIFTVANERRNYISFVFFFFCFFFCLTLIAVVEGREQIVSLIIRTFRGVDREGHKKYHCSLNLKMQNQLRK
jgi:hypothetical protein